MNHRAHTWQAKRVLLPAFLALTVFMIAGCGNGSSDDLAASTGGQGAAPSLPAGTDQANDYPVGQEWRYQVSWGAPADYYRDGFELYQTAIQTCMKDRGFDYTPSPWYDDDKVAVAMNPLNREAAERYGYHRPDYGATNVPGPQLNDPDFADALNGTGATYTTEGGCGELAYNYAYGGSAEDVTLAFDSILGQVSGAIDGFATTTEGIAMLAAWSECMTDQGYHYANPGEADTQFSGNDKVSDDEIRVRLADLDCDTSVGLTAARSEYETNALEQWADANATTTSDYADLLAMAEQQVTERREQLITAGAEALAANT